MATFAEKYEYVMEETSVFKPLDMAMLPVMEHTLVFENEFMLADNFGLPTEKETFSAFVAPPYPFKVDFTLQMFCTAGTMRLRVNLKECLLEAGRVLVVLPGTVGECLEVSGDCQVALIAYVGSRYEQDTDTSSSMLFRRYLAGQSVLTISADEMAESLAIYRAMRRKVEQPDYGFTRGALNGYMQVFFCNGYQWMSRHTRQEEEAGSRVQSRQQMIFERFLWLVQKHYREERGIAFYAGKLCLTPKYLSTVVCRCGGRHAGEWIRDYVILEAKALLRSRQYTAQQVSDLLGFPNASFFGKYFKAATGCSPKQYMLE